METTRLASLTSWRSSVAIRCGLRRRRPLWMKDEAADRLHMGRVGEQVDERDGLEAVAVPCEEACITAERGGVSPYGADSLCLRGGDAAGGVPAEAGPRRIGHDDLD